ncbi:hypothetical protein PU629_18115 [Pullulanibacillus sp. KACC 23026]|uniref:hypothetical protein n=1 Tax=Pullulanibacillus sp. KACC 23026 TaxID=3028315 RepID=UPI0023AEFDB7|nr:hypothetical protein [Pullulanibacillus sp. KACC 23026]WEG12018.1 hypothetical protein PU629_18115 [Pullulanibacillus sp. KACC 23026]
MKATPQEGQIFSDAVDLINNGIESIINLYNDLEPDHPVIQFDQDVVELITRVKEKYGESFVDKKVNSVVKEMLEWLPIEDKGEAKTDGEEKETPSPVRRKVSERKGTKLETSASAPEAPSPKEK